MRADDGQVLSLCEHWARLKKSADFLEIPLPLECRELEKIIPELLLCNDLAGQNAGLRLTLTRGCGPRGLLPPAGPSHNYVDRFSAAGARSRTGACQCGGNSQNEFSPLAQIKSLNYLDNILAKMAAVKAAQRKRFY